MIHGWEPWQWAVYTCLQLVTAYSYALLAYRARVALEPGQRWLATDQFLFQAFVTSCAGHHLTHPMFMFFDWFLAIVLIDSLMAGISLVAAHKMRLGG